MSNVAFSQLSHGIIRTELSIASNGMDVDDFVSTRSSQVVLTPRSLLDNVFGLNAAVRIFEEKPPSAMWVAAGCRLPKYVQDLYEEPCHPSSFLVGDFTGCHEKCCSGGMPDGNISGRE